MFKYADNKDLAQGLLPHQQRVIDKLRQRNALLVYHGLGSGKTLTALAAADALKKPLTIIGPTAVASHYTAEKAKHDIDAAVKAYTYAKPPASVAKDALVVFDEAHRMGRQGTLQSELPAKLVGSKTMMLTATPIRNNPGELASLLSGLGVNVPATEEAFNKKYVGKDVRWPGLIGWLRGVDPEEYDVPKNLDDLRQRIKGYVDYHAPSDENFPSVKRSVVTVDMTPTQQAAHDIAMSGDPRLAYKIRHGLAPSKLETMRLNAFLAASRQISNTPQGFIIDGDDMEGPKITRAAAEIAKRVANNPDYRGLTYSAYKQNGVEALAKLLNKRKIPNAIYDGSLSRTMRDAIIKDYNKGKLKQLLITGAGSEGIDLKGTRLVQLLEPHWNEPQLSQVVGRAARYGSHAHLPKDERNVEVQRYIARPRETGWLFKTRPKGTDEYLLNMALRKKELNDHFLNLLRDVGSK